MIRKVNTGKIIIQRLRIKFLFHFFLTVAVYCDCFFRNICLYLRSYLYLEGKFFLLIFHFILLYLSLPDAVIQISSAWFIQSFLRIPPRMLTLNCFFSAAFIRTRNMHPEETLQNASGSEISELRAKKLRQDQAASEADGDKV